MPSQEATTTLRRKKAAPPPPASAPGHKTSFLHSGSVRRGAEAACAQDSWLPGPGQLQGARGGTYKKSRAPRPPRQIRLQDLHQHQPPHTSPSTSLPRSRDHSPVKPETKPQVQPQSEIRPQSQPQEKLISPPPIAATSATAAVSPSVSAPAGRVGSQARRPFAEKTAENVVPTPAVKSVATIQQIAARATSSKPPTTDQPSVLKPVKQQPLTASAPPPASQLQPPPPPSPPALSQPPPPPPSVPSHLLAFPLKKTGAAKKDDGRQKIVSSANPRDELLMAIRNSGGLKSLKPVRK